MWRLVVVALLATGCQAGGPKQNNLPKDAAPPPPSADAAKSKKRKKIPLPPPQPMPPRPAGEPKTPDDFAKLSDQAAQGKPVQKPGAPPIQRIDAFRFRVGRVLVDRSTRTLEIPAKVNMQEGILEYYGVSSDGKLHESVLELEVEPSHVHLGLVLIDVEPAVIDRSDPMKPPNVTKPGGKLKLTVKWRDKDTGKSHTHGVERWLYDRKTKKAPPAQTWSFLGSGFWQGRYSADMDRSVIGLIPDETVVIAVGADAGNPYQGDGQGYEVHKEAIPAKGTEVTLVVTANDGKPLPTAPPVPPKKQPAPEQPTPAPPTPAQP